MTYIMWVSSGKNSQPVSLFSDNVIFLSCRIFFCSLIQTGFLFRNRQLHYRHMEKTERQVLIFFFGIIMCASLLLSNRKRSNANIHDKIFQFNFHFFWRPQMLDRRKKIIYSEEKYEKYEVNSLYVLGCFP